MEIKVPIEDTLVEKIVRGIMDNFPEASAGSALRCVGWRYDDMRFVFQDCEADEPAKGNHTLTKEVLMAAFPLLFTNKWPKGCTPVPEVSTDKVNSEREWDDWLCAADATDFDAFVQLAIFKDVIYG